MMFVFLRSELCLERPSDSTSRWTPFLLAIKINGKLIDAHVEKGYASIKRRWNPGDYVEIELPMPVKLVESNPKVENNLGKVALLRGPIVHCVEAVDNNYDISGVFIDDNTVVSEVWDVNFNGIIRLELQNQEELFRTIPYFAWSNHGPNAMAVWLEKR